MIGIICAMEIEVVKINEEIVNRTTEVVSGIIFTRGTLYGKEIVTAVCGIGKVFAAICTEAMIIKYNPDVIINTGVGGSLDNFLKIGDVAVSSAVVQHDMDTSPLGDPVGLISGINIVEIPSDKDVCDDIIRCIEKMGVTCKKGVIASGDQFINGNEKKRYIEKTFGAIACEMEGASVGHVCFVNNVKFAVIRAISDGAGDESNVDYPAFAARSAEVSAKALKLYVKECYHG